MINWEAYTEVCESEIAKAQEQLVWYEKGMIERKREYGGDWQDITEESKAYLRQTIETYGKILDALKAKNAQGS